MGVRSGNETNLNFFDFEKFSFVALPDLSPALDPLPDLPPALAPRLERSVLRATIAAPVPCSKLPAAAPQLAWHSGLSLCRI